MCQCAVSKDFAGHTSGYNLASSMTDVRSMSGAVVRAGPLSLLAVTAVPALVPDVIPFIAKNCKTAKKKTRVGLQLVSKESSAS